jgi:hypothetical protein
LARQSIPVNTFFLSLKSLLYIENDEFLTYACSRFLPEKKLIRYLDKTRKLLKENFADDGHNAQG